MLDGIRRALCSGGRTFIMFTSAHQPPEHAHTRTWRETGAGWELTEVWCDAEARVRCSFSFIIRRDGAVVRPKPEPGYHAAEPIRCYTVPELSRMLEQAGFTDPVFYSSADLSSPPPAGPEVWAARDIVVAKRAA